MSREGVRTFRKGLVVPTHGRDRGATLVLAPDAEVARPAPSLPVRDAWGRFRQNGAAVISLAVLCCLMLAAVLAPFLHTVSPIAVDYGSLDQGPSPHHWLGTDGVGSDIYSRLLYGLRVPFVVAAIGTTVAVALGTLLGLLSGYCSDLVDALLSRFTEVMFAFPGFLLALVVASFFGHALDPALGGSGRMLVLTIVFALVGWPALMRFVRSLALGLREQQFVDAARVCGCTGWGVVTEHLLPNVWGPVLVQASFIFVHMVGLESALSLFGLGVQSPNPDLGVMLFEGEEVLGLNPWELVVPAIALSTIVVAGTFVGDGLRDAFDPRR